MRWLLFLSRAGFLCGIMMILAFSMLFVNWNKGEAISGSIVLAGYGLALVLIPLINFMYLVLYLLGKKPARVVPRWLIAFNIGCFFLLLACIFFFNDPYYHQK